MRRKSARAATGRICKHTLGKRQPFSPQRECQEQEQERGQQRRAVAMSITDIAVAARADGARAGRAADHGIADESGWLAGPFIRDAAKPRRTSNK